MAEELKNCLAAGMPLSIAAISSQLNTAVIGSTLAVLQSVGSTNLFIKQRSDILDDGFTVVSETQLAGRGRLGRTFLSPKGGLYMSVFLLDHRIAADPVGLTVRAAVAVARAIRKLTGLAVGIKWVNDIYYNGKKLCGILAERVVLKGQADFTVLGIGVNVSSPKGGFAGEVSDIAASLSDFSAVIFSKNELCAEILNQLEDCLVDKEPDSREKILDEYRALSVIIGKEVDVLRGDSSRRAAVLGIDDDAALYVQYTDGTTDILRTGEVSTRPIRSEASGANGANDANESNRTNETEEDNG